MFHGEEVHKEEPMDEKNHLSTVTPYGLVGFRGVKFEFESQNSVISKVYTCYRVC